MSDVVDAEDIVNAPAWARAVKENHSMQSVTQRLVIAQISKGQVRTETLTNLREIEVVEKALQAFRDAGAAADKDRPDLRLVS